MADEEKRDEGQGDTPKDGTQDWRSEESAALERRVAGALRSCIDAHGPITREWVGSAAKRVVNQLLKGD